MGVVTGPMRVLITTRHLGIVGGIETYLRVLLHRLVASGFELVVLVEFGDSAEGIMAACKGVPIWTTTGMSIEELLAKVERWGPDVVYSHGLENSELEAALAVRFPTVLYAHNYLGTCVSGTKCHARPGYEPCRRRLGPACLALYLPRRCGGLNPITAVRMYRQERRRQRTFQDYRVVLVASRHMADEVIRNGVPADRVQTVPLFPTGIAPDAVPPAQRPRAGRVLFLGRITSLKGWSHLIDAIPQAATILGHPLALVVAGDGPDRVKFEVAARRAGVPAEFLGWVGPERKEAAMRAADVLAVPSVWPEPFGLVGIEGGCVGLPAVAYAVGGIPDWLEPECRRASPRRAKNRTPGSWPRRWSERWPTTLTSTDCGSGHGRRRAGLHPTLTSNSSYQFSKRPPVDPLGDPDRRIPAGPGRCERLHSARRAGSRRCRGRSSGVRLPAAFER